MTFSHFNSDIALTYHCPVLLVYNKGGDRHDNSKTNDDREDIPVLQRSELVLGDTQNFVHDKYLSEKPI